jgi:quinol monooxygenase YgiN
MLSRLTLGPRRPRNLHPDLRRVGVKRPRCQLVGSAWLPLPTGPGSAAAGCGCHRPDGVARPVLEMGDQAGVGDVPAELAALDPATCLVLECVGGGLGQPALGDQPVGPSVDDREGHDPSRHPGHSTMRAPRPMADGSHRFVEGSLTMVMVGLLVRLVAKPGKEAEVTSFLEGGLALAQEEPATIAWFAIRLGPSEFGIFDAFPDDAGRQAHLGGRVAAALMAQAPELLAQPPGIEPVDVLAAKLPGQQPLG